MSEQIHDLLLTDTQGRVILVDAFSIATASRYHAGYQGAFTLLTLKDVHPKDDYKTNTVLVQESIEEIADLRAKVGGNLALRAKSPS